MDKSIYSSDKVRVSENLSTTLAQFNDLFQMDKAGYVHYRGMSNMKIHSHLKMNDGYFKKWFLGFDIALKWPGKILLYSKRILRGIPQLFSNSTNFSPGSVFFVLVWLLRSQVYQGWKCILSSAPCLQLCKQARKRQVWELFLMLRIYI